MGAVVTEIVGIMTQGLTGIATGIGGGLSTLVQNIFLDGEGDAAKLSLFGGVIVVFAGISLAIGLSKWVVNWVTSLGASH